MPARAAAEDVTAAPRERRSPPQVGESGEVAVQAHPGGAGLDGGGRCSDPSPVM
jgi:hypothetical protein